MTLALNIPVLDTDRLRLRGPEATDFDAIAAFYADPDRASGFGGPLSRDDAWRWFALSVGHWALHGYGFFTVTLKDSGAACGLCGIWNPEGWPEPEIGWVLFDGFEGKGYALEAATRVRAWAYDDLGFTTLTSNILHSNHRSAALAEKMGAWHERDYDNVHMGHDRLFRHPGPEALT